MAQDFRLVASCGFTPSILYRAYDTVRQRLRDKAVRGGWEIKISGLDEQMAQQRLSALNAARKLDDLSRLRSVGLHKLTGDRAGHWALRINGPWGLVFRFADGDAFDVEIVDYH